MPVRVIGASRQWSMNSVSKYPYLIQVVASRDRLTPPTYLGFVKAEDPA